VVLHRWYEVSDLENEWLSGLGFNPFSELEVEDTLMQYRCLDCDLRLYHPAFCGDSKFYEELSSRFSWYYEKDKWEFDKAIDLLAGLKDVVNILEIGCGHGYFLKRINRAYKVSGIELNLNAVSACQSDGLRVSGLNLKDVNEIFDMVVAFEVLEHVDSPHEFLSQALNRVRSGGYLMLAVPDPDGYFSEANKVLLDMPPHHVLSFSKAALGKIADLFNLTQVDISQEPLRFIHYKSYASNFLTTKVNEKKQKTFIQKFLSKTIGLPINALARSVDLFESRLTELALAISYQAAKDKLLGQTHLVLYKKL
jgi:SAM-dependent methyltransferase